MPTARGIAPGNGALVGRSAAVRGRRARRVAGKPSRPLFDETMRRAVAPNRPLVVGDRLDTDIEGATNAETDALLVLSGITDLAGACRAVGVQRPAYVSWTLRGLTTGHRAPQPSDDDGARLSGWEIGVDGDALQVRATGTDPDEGLRVAVQAAWWWVDRGGDVNGLGGLDRVASALNTARSSGREGTGH